MEALGRVIIGLGAGTIAGWLIGMLTTAVGLTTIDQWWGVLFAGMLTGVIAGLMAGRIR